MARTRRFVSVWFLLLALGLGLDVRAAVWKCRFDLIGKPEQLRQLFDPATPTEVLRQQILARIGQGGLEDVAAWAIEDMKSRGGQILSPANLKEKRVLFIGAGIHSAIALSNFVARDPEIAKHTLVLDRSPSVTANYAQDQPFRINSGKPRFVPDSARPNEFFGALISPEDVRYHDTDPYPNPKLFALATAIDIRAQGVDTGFGNGIVGWRENLNRRPGEARYTVKLADGREIPQDILVLGVGVSQPPDNVEGMKEMREAENAKMAGDRDYNRYVPRVEQAIQYLARLGNEGPRDFAAYDDKVLFVFGGQHTGNITVETFLGKIPEMQERGFHAKPRKIVWFGQPAKTGADFLARQKPGGATDPRQLFSERYAKYGIPEAIDSHLIEAVAEKATRIEQLPDGRLRAHWKDEQGHDHFVDGDFAFDATGVRSPALSLVQSSFGGNAIGTPGGPTLRPVQGEPGQTPPGAVQVIGPDGREQDIFLIGPGVGIPTDPQALAQTVTGSPESINALGPGTQAFGKWLRERYRQQFPTRSASN